MTREQIDALVEEAQDLADLAMIDEACALAEIEGDLADYQEDES